MCWPGKSADKSPPRHVFSLTYNAQSLGTEASECNQILLCEVGLAIMKWSLPGMNGILTSVSPPWNWQPIKSRGWYRYVMDGGSKKHPHEVLHHGIYKWEFPALECNWLNPPNQHVWWSDSNIENWLDMVLRSANLQGSDDYHVNMGELSIQDRLLGLDCRQGPRQKGFLILSTSRCLC
jgi:hypothetical protein